MGPTGYVPATRLPARKRGTSGTRTLEMVTLNGGRILSKRRGPGTGPAPPEGSARRAGWGRVPQEPTPVQLPLLLRHAGRFGDGIEPGHRVVDVAGQRDQHPRDLVPELLGLLVGPGRDRHHGHERPLCVFLAGSQAP